MCPAEIIIVIHWTQAVYRSQPKQQQAACLLGLYDAMSGRHSLHDVHCVYITNQPPMWVANALGHVRVLFVLQLLTALT